MTKITVLGREFVLGPYKLGAMIAAAPFIDAQKARQEEIAERSGIKILPTDAEDVRRQKVAQIALQTTMVEHMENLQDIVSVLHVGISRSDPSITVSAILDDIEPTPLRTAELLAAMQAVLKQSGMQSGEGKASSVAAAPEKALSEPSA